VETPPEVSGDRMGDLGFHFGRDSMSDGVGDLLPDLAGLTSHVFSTCGCGTPELMRVRDGVIDTSERPARTRCDLCSLAAKAG